MSGYEVLKFVHIVLAIVAIGFNASYGVWLARLAKEPEHAVHVLKGIKTLDDRFANPAYALLLVTGLILVVTGNWEFSSFWIATAIGLYVVLVLGGALLYTPTLRRQVALAEAGSVGSPEYGALSKRGATLGIALAVIVLTIEFLMVTKPTL